MFCACRGHLQLSFSVCDLGLVARSLCSPPYAFEKNEFSASYCDNVIIIMMMIMEGLWRPEEDIASPRTGVLDSYEPLDAGAGNQTRVLFKNSADA